MASGSKDWARRFALPALNVAGVLAFFAYAAWSLATLPDVPPAPMTSPVPTPPPDPRTVRLETGSTAIVYESADEDLGAIADMKAGRGKFGGFTFLEPGTRVTVVEDPAGPATGTRKVRVNLQEGDYAGESAWIERGVLRPVPR